MKVFSNLLLFGLLILLSLLSCKQKRVIPSQKIDTFLDEVIGIDEEAQILLYNGQNIDLTTSSLSLDQEVIVIETDTLNQIALGDPYTSEWRNNTYRFYRTELPILKIQTRENTEISEAYESAQFALIENGLITLKGNLGLKLRGNTSLSFPKKSYRLEFWEDTEGVNNRDVSLLNMRDDDDWLLDGMWNEPLSIRDKSAMELWLSYGRVNDTDKEDIVLGAAREYCELFINGAYKGLYYVGERLDRKQLKLDKCTSPSDGGELYKAKGWDAAVIAFSLPPYDNNNLYWGGYEVKYPQEIGKYDWQNLKEFIAFFIDNLPADFENIYPQKLDTDNLIDYFIQINLLYAYDNAGNNVYIARKNPSSPYYFVSWDYDATLGIGLNGGLFDVQNDFIQHPVTNRLFISPSFKDKLKKRWADLRANQLTFSNIITYYHDNHSILLRNKLYEREAMISQLDKPVPSMESMMYLEETLNERLQYLDDAIKKL
ncbi:MAG: CotH kinase family protein [Bacteroidota bacterium]